MKSPISPIRTDVGQRKFGLDKSKQGMQVKKREQTRMMKITLCFYKSVNVEKNSVKYGLPDSNTIVLIA